MIPEFPNFKTIEPGDREEVEAITRRYPQYSDFNFTSMWSWDCRGLMGVSVHNGNLVIRFTDYLTEKPFYSFLGDKDADATASALLSFSEAEGLEPMLKLVPDASVRGLEPSRFEISEDRDNFDYILDCSIVAGFVGHDLRGHASFKRRFIEACGADLETKSLDVSDPAEQERMLELNKTWIRNKLSENKDVFPDIELKATHRFFDACTLEKERFLAFGVFYKGELVAYTVDEILVDGMAIRHFMKADNSLKGAYSYLVSEATARLIEAGAVRLNIEQDLGLANLRQSKKTFCPVDYLKKHIVRPVNNV